MKKQPFRFHVVLLSVLFTAAVFLPFELTAQEEDGEVRDRLEDLEQRQEELEEENQQLRGTVEQLKEEPNKPVEETGESDPDDLNVYTSDGSGKLRFESVDGDFQGRFGGRIMFDYTAGSIDSNVETATGAMNDGTEFRRARLFTSGELYRIGYKFQLDFAGAPDMKDAYLAFPSPVSNSSIKVGKFKEDISLVEQTSSKYITFMARPIMTVFAGGRDLGVRLGGDADDGNLNYGIGTYRSTTDDALGPHRATEITK